MKPGLIFAAVVSVVAVPTAICSQDEKATPKSEGPKVLEAFVGAWKTEVTDKPAKWLPGGAKRQVQESISQILNKRFILGREADRTAGSPYG
jgi:hypothetical protein